MKDIKNPKFLINNPNKISLKNLVISKYRDTNIFTGGRSMLFYLMSTDHKIIGLSYILLGFVAGYLVHFLAFL